MSKNSKKLPPIPDELENTLFEIIDTHGSIKEHELLQKLATNGFLQFQPSLEPLELFRSHFLLFHILYRLEEKWIKSHQRYLTIDVLNIQLLERAEIDDFKETNNPELFNALRHYYLNYEEFLNTQEQDVIELLDSFWQGFGQIHSQDEIQLSQQTLELGNHPTQQEIKTQFRKLSQKHHPDKGGDNEVFKQLVKAREILLSTYEN